MERGNGGCGGTRGGTAGRGGSWGNGGVGGMGGLVPSWLPSVPRTSSLAWTRSSAGASAAMLRTASTPGTPTFERASSPPATHAEGHVEELLLGRPTVGAGVSTRGRLLLLRGQTLLVGLLEEVAIRGARIELRACMKLR